MKQLIKTSMVLALSLFISSVWAGSVSSLNTFVTGQPAVAADVNANFTAAATAIDDNDARINTNATDIGTNSTAIGNLQSSATATVGDIQANAGGISDNATNIGNLQSSATASVSDIAANTTAISTNTTDISNLQSSVTANATAVSTLGVRADGIDSTLTDYGLRITGLESSSTATSNPSPTGTGTTVANSTADNPPISVNCANGESLQAAIETAPLHGRVEITISGDCNDDIFVRRNGITIRGTDPTQDSITGNASGFSSSMADNFNTVGGTETPLVSRPPNTSGPSMRAAVEVFARARVKFANLTINGGNNRHGLRIVNNKRIVLDNVIINAGTTSSSYGLRVVDSSVQLSNTTVNGGGGGTSTNSFFFGSELFADRGSNITLNGNNIFDDTNLTDEDSFGIALGGNSNLWIRVGTGNNIMDSLGLFEGSSFIQSRANTGNQINGDLEICGNSTFYVQNMNINSGEIEVCRGGRVVLEPSQTNAIAITATRIGNY